ncbi:hypothetical protein NSS82_19020 [Paenibacillus sp. FSL H7-0735]|uniref:hypothetical protein n=1 Tax=Paenibacillus sp. FSL H7-0735 TaxID=2954736 RepID=UPI0030F4D90A
MSAPIHSSLPVYFKADYYQFPKLEINIDKLPAMPLIETPHYIEREVTHLGNNTYDGHEIYKLSDFYYLTIHSDNEIYKRDAEYGMIQMMTRPDDPNNPGQKLNLRLDYQHIDLNIFSSNYYSPNDNPDNRKNFKLFTIQESDSFNEFTEMNIVVNCDNFSDKSGNKYVLIDGFSGVQMLADRNYYAVNLVRRVGQLGQMYYFAGLFKSTDLMTFELIYVDTSSFSHTASQNSWMLFYNFIYVNYIRYDIRTFATFDMTQLSTTSQTDPYNNLVKFYGLYQKLSNYVISDYVYDSSERKYYYYKMTEDATKLEKFYLETDNNDIKRVPLIRISWFRDPIRDELYFLFGHGEAPYDKEINFSKYYKSVSTYQAEPGIIYKENVNEFLKNYSVTYSTDYMNTSATFEFLVDHKGKDVWAFFGPNKAQRAFKRGNNVKISAIYPLSTEVKMDILNGKITNVEASDVASNSITVNVDIGASKLHKKKPNFTLPTDSLGGTLERLIIKAGYTSSDIYLPITSPSVNTAFYSNDNYIDEHITILMAAYPNWIFYRRKDNRFELKKIDNLNAKYTFEASEIKSLGISETQDYYNVVTVTSTHIATEGYTARAEDITNINEWGENELALESDHFDTQAKLNNYVNEVLAFQKQTIYHGSLTVINIRADLNIGDTISIIDPNYSGATANQRFVIIGMDISGFVTTIHFKSILLF